MAKRETLEAFLRMKKISRQTSSLLWGKRKNLVGPNPKIAFFLFFVRKAPQLTSGSDVIMRRDLRV
jgi:hypothetical protein